MALVQGPSGLIKMREEVQAHYNVKSGRITLI